MKSFLGGLAVTWITGTLFIGVLGWGPVFDKPVEQPIRFNHRAHKDIDCVNCHEFVKSQSFAGLPAIEVCLTCHDTPLTESPEEEKIRTLAQAGKPIEWKRLFKQPAHVYYSHRRHVEIAQLDCSQCHGDIGNSIEPPARVKNLSMNACLACHDKRSVKATCVDCHR